MNEEIPKEVLEAFTRYTPNLPDHSAGKITSEILGGGLINNSYKISCELKDDFLLQRINKYVFTHPEHIQENYINIWQFAEYEFTGLRLPSPIYFDRTTTLYVDDKENYWRAFEFIDDGKALSIAEKPSQAKAAAAAFAKFTAAFNEFNVSSLKNSIPGFHDLSLRYSQFEQSLNTELYERMTKAQLVISELKRRELYKHFFEVIIESDEFPQRVMHHDAKIANILFHKKTGKVICPVDFDTVMPGYYFSDLGDLIRSLACNLDENSIDFENIQIRKEFYEGIVDGYSQIMNPHFTKAEKKYLHAAGLLILFMQSLRFITDYLNGDVYYKVEYPQQNLQRARNQLTLLNRLEEFLKKEYKFSI